MNDYRETLKAEIEEAKRRPKATLVYADDWTALYLDGKLCMEGHSLYEGDILQALDCEVTVEYFAEDEHGEIVVPKSLSEVKFK